MGTPGRTAYCAWLPEDLKNQLSLYLKNDMEQDVQAVIDQAKIIGDSAFIRVNNILKDLDSKK